VAELLAAARKRAAKPALRVLLDCPTRSGSMFFMLKGFDEMREEIVCAQREFFSKKMTYQGAGPQVSSLELAQVISLHELIEYAEEASVRLGAE
jgi:hypothetical protein